MEISPEKPTILSLPSIIGHIVAGPKPRTERIRVKRLPTSPGHGAAPSSKKVPLSTYKKRTAKFVSRYATTREAEECCIFRHCDACYQAFTPEQKKVWYDAIKRSKISPYDLWMSECMTACLLHEPAPDAPSISGGWSTTKVQPGTGVLPDWCWETPTVRSPAASYTIERDWDDPWLRFNFSAQWNPWAWELPPEQQILRLSWWEDYDSSWHYDVTLDFTDFPGLRDYGQNPATNKFVISWPNYPPHLVTAPVLDPGSWSHFNPNHLPWPPPPIPPDPWPNPPA